MKGRIVTNSYRRRQQSELRNSSALATDKKTKMQRQAEVGGFMFEDVMKYIAQKLNNIIMIVMMILPFQFSPDALNIFDCCALLP
jgi:hypothetical protein